MTAPSYSYTEVLLYKYQKDAELTNMYLTELYRNKIIKPKIMKLESETNRIAENCKRLEKRLKDLEDKI